ncbi:hypothetical protein MKW98_028476 [Papaver atlanticum]|uniref:Cytochrome P450 n=1 Tax=Papaver atlanticum TaxID=357466 RepID=A0AAD4TGU8_9MAGN|nr:hypothetical protein MKW98_028476 [Papaver atlanticum]
MIFGSQILVTILIIVFSIYSLNLFFSIRKNGSTTTSRSASSGGNKQLLPPGRSRLSFISETMDFFRASLDGVPEKFFFDRIQKYSSQVFKTSLFTQTVTVIGVTASGNKFLLSNEYKLVNSWFPKSILDIFPLGKKCVGNQEFHKWLRRMYSQSLNPGSVHNFVGVMDSMTRQHFETYWDKNINTVNDDEGMRITTTVQPLVSKNSFAIACRYTLGIDYHLESHWVDELYKLFSIVNIGILSLPINLPGTKLNRSIKAYKLIEKNIQKVFEQRNIDVSSYSDDTKNGRASMPQDMLSRLIIMSQVDSSGIDEKFIIDLVIGIMFGSSTSMGVVMTLIVKYLSDFPDVYNKVLEEQTAVAYSKGTRELLNFSDIQKMKYSWNMICEVMRVSTPSPVGFKTASDDLWYDGYFISKGTKLCWSAAGTHMNPDCFTNPKKFDPCRFEEGNKLAPYTFIPFGGGPSVCPGKEFAQQEMLVFLHQLVRRYKWEKHMPNHDEEEEKIRFKPYPLVTTGHSIHLRPHLN